MVTYFFVRVLKFFQSFRERNSLPGGFRLWVTFSSLIFVGYAIFLNSGKLIQINISSTGIFWLLVAFVISFLSILVNAIAWRTLIFWLGYNAIRIDLISLFLSSNLLKYLPGGIWHFVERLRVLNKYIGPSKAIGSVLLEPFLMASAAFLLVAFGGWQSGIGLLTLLPAITFIRYFREPILKKLEQLKSKQIKRISKETNFTSEQEMGVDLRDGYPFKALTLEIFFVLLRFGGFWCCLKAFSIDSSIFFTEWIAAFSLAWTIGLIVPAAPGGLGIFEAILLIRVGSSAPEALLLASLLSYRFIATIVDLFAALLASFKRSFHPI